MYCPQCGSELPVGATYCTQCAAVVDPVDHIVKTVGRVTKDVFQRTGSALDRAAKNVGPTVDKTVRTLRPVAEDVGNAARDVARSVKPAAQKAVQATKDAADKAAKAVGPVVEKAAGTTEQAARNLKETIRRKRGP